jgi:WD40 repeat protein
VWNAETGALLYKLGEHQSYVEGVSITSAADLILSHCKKQARLWAAESGRHIASFVAEEDIAASAISPDGRRIVVCDKKGTVHTLELKGVVPGSRPSPPL